MNKEKFKDLLNMVKWKLTRLNELNLSEDKLASAMQALENAEQALWDFVNPDKWHVLDITQDKYFIAYGHYEKYGTGQRFVTLVADDDDFFSSFEDAQKKVDELNAL